MKVKVFVYFLIVLLAIGYVLWNDPEAIQHEKNLQNEFQNIVTFQGAKSISYSSMHERGQALIVAKYFTDASYSQVERYYRQEFAKHGWVFQRTKNITNWGEPISEAKKVYFKKQDYSLSFSYYGNDYSDNTFSIVLSWGGGNN